MKKVFLSLCLFMMFSFLSAQVMNENNVLTFDSIFIFNGKTQGELFLIANQYLSQNICKNNYSSQKISSGGSTDKYNGINYSMGQINFIDKESGTIIVNGNFSANDKSEKDLFGDWNALLDYSLTIKTKDGKMKLSIIVPSVTFIFTNNPNPESVDIKYLYPQCTLKSGMTRLYSIPKKAPKLIPDAAKNIRDFISSIYNSLKQIVCEEDF